MGRAASSSPPPLDQRIYDSKKLISVSPNAKLPKMTEVQGLDLASPAPCGVSFIFGVLLHLCIFRVGEWDLYTPHLLAGPILLYGLATVGITRYTTDGGLVPSLQCAGTVALLWACCVAGLFCSILVYRAAFHRLNRFPGPFLARLSNLYVTSLSVKRFHLFKEVQQLHAQYGDIVRLGESPLPPLVRPLGEDSCLSVCVLTFLFFRSV